MESRNKNGHHTGQTLQPFGVILSATCLPLFIASGQAADELGFPVKAKQDVYSSDSTPFADKGIPAVSFARIAPGNTATIHNSYDTMALMKYENMAADISFITAFSERMVNAARCPVAREMPDNMKEELDYYLLRKRKNK